MKALLEKHEKGLTIGLIILYVVVNSYCLNNFGTTDYKSAIINTVFSSGLIALMLCLKRTKYYGLTKIKNAKGYLFFIPLLLIASVNLWNGINMNNTRMEVMFHFIMMVNVGFIEEVIFRGFLFKLMEKSNVKSAMIVSALTFGVGHIANLFTGADVVQTLLQICYATTIGFLFVTIFYKSKSLIPCILTHAAINSLSIFNGDNKTVHYIASAFLVVVPIVYTCYINKNVKETV